MKRALLRENTFRLLYLSDFHEEEELDTQVDRYLEKMENLEDIEELQDFNLEDLEYPISKKDKEFIKGRLLEIGEHIEEIDLAINNAAEKWTTDRMSKIDLTILRLAYFEIHYDESVPERVAVDQAVELAKKYGTDDSSKFINGVLAKFLKK